MAYLLGVDFGGGSCKVTLLSPDGTVVASKSNEYRSLCPQPLYIEQDPEEIYQTFVLTVRSLLSEQKGDISCVSLDGGTHIAVLMDQNDQVIRPAIYWSDGRSTKEAQWLQATTGALVKQETFNIPSSTWTLPQLLWLRKHQPEAYQRIRKIRFLKDYIRFRLTGDYVTDSIEAMGSLFEDARSDRWSPELCAIAGLDPETLPKIVHSREIVGTVSEKAASETGLSTKVKVVAGATDTVMELFASGAVHEGDATVKLATAGRICVVSPEPVVDRCLVTYKHIVEGLWYPGTATKTCASSLRWFRDQLSRDPSYQKIDQEAAKIPVGSDGLFFHPYLQGELTPYQDNALRASFIGISSATTYGHFCRSVLEGVAYSLFDSMEVLHALRLQPKGMLRLIGGGSRSPLWAQIVSDVLGLPLVKVLTDDSSIGSAMLAGVATGVFASWDDAVSATTKEGRVFQPDEENHRRYLDGFAKYQRIAKAMQVVYQEMNR